MNFRRLDKRHEEELAGLFSSAFTSSEGEEEGRLIEKLVSALSANIDNQGVICFGAYEREVLVGSIFFTRLRFSQPILVYMLSPVAVSTAHQGKGIGQALINHGLNDLKRRSVDVAVTYGDPAFYSKVGFQALSERVIQAPIRLSQPEGWLGQSLSGKPIPVIPERPACTKEFDDSAYW